MKTPHIVILLLTVLFTVALPFMSLWASSAGVGLDFPEPVSKQIVYQSVTLGLTLLFLWVVRCLRKDIFKRYFQKGRVNAQITPEPFIGIKPGAKENWLHLGINFSMIITAVTAVVMYFQVVRGREFFFVRMLQMLPLTVLFALVNSFVEESITRFGIVAAFEGVVGSRVIPFLSGGLFGVVHFWGHPGGPAGLLFAGFLGWFLTKSILETKGIFWAWLIHFLQDVVILSLLLTYV